MTALDLAGLYDRLDAKRETLGISWREVCRQADVSAALPQRIREKQDMNVGTFNKLVDWLGDDPLAAYVAAAELRQKRPASKNPDLPEVLKRLVLIASNLSDAGAPRGEDGVCVLCRADLDNQNHDEEECGWRIARSLAPTDLDAVRRLARALGYRRHP